MTESTTLRPPTQPTEGCSGLPTDPNVGANEQWVSMLAGGGLIALGLARPSRWRLLSLLAGASLLYRGLTGHCAMYEGLGIDTSGPCQSGSYRGVRAQHGRNVKWTVHVNRDRRDLYDLWRNLENLPNIMRHIKSVTPLDEKRSRWQAQTPLGSTLTWEAEIITDRYGEVIAWQSLPGSQVDSAGSVHFKSPAVGEGTKIEVSLKFDPPGGSMVAGLAYYLGQGLEQQVEEDLRRFKHLMEAGEIATATTHP